jgi:hypothetical protein
LQDFTPHASVPFDSSAASIAASGVLSPPPVPASSSIGGGGSDDVVVEDCAPLFFVPHAANTNTKLAQYAVRIAVTPL